jgi:hypothetical protein
MDDEYFGRYMSPAHTPEYFDKLATQWCTWNAVQQAVPRRPRVMMMSATPLATVADQMSIINRYFTADSLSRLIGLPVAPGVEGADVASVSNAFIRPDLRMLFLREFQFTSRFLRGVDTILDAVGDGGACAAPDDRLRLSAYRAFSLRTHLHMVTAHAIPTVCDSFFCRIGGLT